MAEDSATVILGGLRRTITEEADVLRRLVRDEDADCISRDLRAERLRAYEHVLAVIERMETWEWGFPMRGADDASEDREP